MAKDRAHRETAQPARQYAALPIRVSGRGALQIMLVTSRGTKRWIIPKGWPMPHRTPGATAAREAFEEAGLEGTLERDEPIGHYTYRKRLGSGRSIQVEVEVFVLVVKRQHRNWPERAQRKTRWYDASTASRLVEETALAELILRTGRNWSDAISGEPPLA